jgi:hypothetical protein
MQFLILHKVRGEPAFDIAEKATFGNEEGWILCTCGHRAYPYKTWELYKILEASYIDCPDPPDGWPEHYNAHPEPKKVTVDMSTFFSSVSNFRRRI